MPWLSSFDLRPDSLDACHQAFAKLLLDSRVIEKRPSRATSISMLLETVLRRPARDSEYMPRGDRRLTRPYAVGWKSKPHSSSAPLSDILGTQQKAPAGDRGSCQV
jgi:hypothetical protein